MSVRKASHGTIFLIVSSGSPLALIASSRRSTSKKPFCPMTRSLHPPATAGGQRVRFAATWRDEFFEVPSCLFSDLREDGLIASRSITAGSTDGADGADAIFGTCAQPDHSRPRTTFTGKRDLDPQRPEKRLRPPQSTGEHARIFCP